MRDSAANLRTEDRAASLRWTDSHHQLHLYYLALPETIVGRRSDADVMINEPNVSRRHFSVVQQNGGYLLKDLGSTLGTFVNGQKIQNSPLQHGDKIRLGPEGPEIVYLLLPRNLDGSGNLDAGTAGALDLKKSLRGVADLLPEPASEASDLEKLSLLLDLHFNWGKTFSSEAAFQAILKSALEISGAERGFILLQQPQGFRFQAGMDGSGSALPESAFRTSQTVVQRVAETEQPVLMTEQIGGEFAAQESIVAMNVRAVACLPLMATLPGSDGPELLGILYLDSQKRMHDLSVLDRRIMTKLAEQAGAVLEKLELIKTADEQEKIKQDLIQASEIQRSLLPQEVPQLPTFRIHHFNHPTRHVGGDFYDFLKLQSGELVGLLADVSGKGVPAALLASLAQGALQMEFENSSRCDVVLTQVNKLLCRKAVADRFMTLFVTVLAANGAGHYISAGHNTAYLYRANTGRIEELPSNGLILGVFPAANYERVALQLGDRDILVVYSDGVTEAEGPGDEMFGEERLRNIILSEGAAGSHALERKLLGALEAFTRGMPQTDDITFVLIEKRPAAPDTPASVADSSPTNPA